MDIGLMRVMATCTFSVLIVIDILTMFVQDFEFLLQKHRVYRRPMVVPNILCLEFNLVSLSYTHSVAIKLTPKIAYLNIPTSCSGIHFGRLHLSSLLVYLTGSLVCLVSGGRHPVVLIAVSDAHILMDLPELYRFGREGSWFGIKWFIVYMFDGVVQVRLVSV